MMLGKTQPSKKDGIIIIYLMSLYFPSYSKRFFVLKSTRIITNLIQNQKQTTLEVEPRTCVACQRLGKQQMQIMAKVIIEKSQYIRQY